MGTAFTVRQGDELYVYVRGLLVMKKWLDGRQPTALFQSAPAQTLWLR